MFIHHRILMTSQRWTLTILLRHNVGDRNRFALVCIGNDVLRWWGVNEKWVINQTIFQCIKTNWYLRSERAAINSGVKQKSHLLPECSVFNQNEPQRTDLMPRCMDFSIWKVTVILHRSGVNLTFVIFVSIWER